MFEKYPDNSFKMTFNFKLYLLITMRPSIFEGFLLINEPFFILVEFKTFMYCTNYFFINNLNKQWQEKEPKELL